MKHQKSNGQTYNLLYHSARCILRPILDILGHLESHGNENIPRQGGCLFVSNHVSFLDPVIIGVATARELHFLGADSYFHIPCLGWLFTQLNGIPIKRKTPGWQPLKRAISCLKAGKALLMFPEGTRSADGTLGEIKIGAGFIIHHSNVPVIPVFLKGAERFMPRDAKFIRPTKLSVAFGPPLNFTHLKGTEQKQELYRQTSEEVRQAILTLKENSY